MNRFVEKNIILKKIIFENYTEQSHVLNLYQQKADENLAHALRRERGLTI